MKAFIALFFCALLAVGAQANDVTIDNNPLLTALLGICSLLSGGNPCDLLSELNTLGGSYSISNGDSLSITTSTQLNANISAITLASLNLGADIGSTFSLVGTTIQGAFTVANSNIAQINSTLTAAGTTLVTGGASIIANAGSVVQFNGGLNIDATSSGANQGLIVNGGASVTINAASTINGALNLAADSAFVVAQGTTTVANGIKAYGNTTVQSVLAFTSGLYEQAQGNLILATSTAAGAVQAVVATTVTIDSGANLRGTGNITGDLTIQGTVAPGFSPGTVWVNGNFALTSTSTYELDIQDASTYDNTIVSGSATINGILYAHLLNNFAPSNKEQFTFITAVGDVSGSFSIVHGDANANINKWSASEGSHTVVAQFSSATTTVASIFLLAVAITIASL